MPRSQKKRTRRTQTAPPPAEVAPVETSGRRRGRREGETPEPTRRGAETAGGAFRPAPRTPGSGDVEPEPWSYRGMAALMAIVALLQVPLSLVTWFQEGRQKPFGAYLVVSLLPPVIPLTLFASFLLAMPLARRVAGEPRSMRILETLSVAAIVLILLVAFWAPVLNAKGNRLDAYDLGQMAGAAAADIAALAVGAAVYPLIYRRFWMPRRRMRR